MPKRKRQPTAEQIRRDERDSNVRRVLGLITLYEEMMESLLRADAFDEELVRRMIGTRETILLLVESAVPIPLDAGRVEEIGTPSRARH